MQTERLDSSGAIKCYEQVIAPDPKDGIVYSAKGSELLRMGDYRGAANSFEQVDVWICTAATTDIEVGIDTLVEGMLDASSH